MNAVTELQPTNRMLPLFLTREMKYPVGWSVLAFAAGMYLISNHFHFLVPQELPRSWVDLAVPFLPGTFWIYLSEYLLFVVVFVVTDNMVNLNKFIYSFLCLQITSCLIFWAWPTTYPRAEFPLPQGLDSLTAFAFSTLRQTDTPANCCPSLHVSSCFLASFLYIDEQRRYLPFFFFWAAAIAVSTLTTKQHYLIDVVTGFFMAVLHFWFFHRWMQYKDVQGAHANL